MNIFLLGVLSFFICYLLVFLLIKLLKGNIKPIDFLYGVAITFAVPFVIIGGICMIITYCIFLLCDNLDDV